MLMIREVTYDDLDALLELYLHLHDKAVPEHNDHLEKTWNEILNNSRYHIIVCEVDEERILRRYQAHGTHAVYNDE